MPNAVTAVILAATSPTPSPTQRQGKPEVHGVFGFGSIVFFIFAMAIIAGLIYVNARRNNTDPPKRDGAQGPDDAQSPDGAQGPDDAQSPGASG